MAVTTIAVLSGCGQNSANVGAISPGLGTGGIPNGFGNGACVPVNQAISFVGQNIYMDWANVVGGTLPSIGSLAQAQGSVGQIAVGMGGIPQGGYGVAQFSTGWGNSQFGSVQMSASSAGQAFNGMPYSGFPQGTYAPSWYNSYQSQPGYTAGYINVQGSVTLSQMSLYDMSLAYGSFGFNQTGGIALGGIQGSVPGSFPMTGFGGQSLCVSQMAINLGHWNQTLYGGNVFLYLNGTQNLYVLQF